MPWSAPVSIAEIILKKSRLRMKLRTAWVATMISHSGTRMLRSGRNRRRWVTTARMQSASCAATLAWISAGKCANHPLQRLGAGGGVDGGHHQVARFRRAQRQAHRFRLPHFPDHQDVGILPQRINQRLLETRRVPPHFALAQVSAPRPENVFDGALDRDDVPRFGEVDLLD